MFKNFIKHELDNDTFKFVLLLALAVAIVNYNFLSQFKTLPSPIYGGDYYNHLGSMYHIYYGGSIFQNGQMNNEIQWAPWLYHVYVVILSKITGLDPMLGIIYSSLPLIFVSSIIIYLILSRFTSEKLLILSILLIFLATYPIYKYTLFAFFVASPLMILAWFLFLEKQTENRFLFLAIAIAFAHLSSTQLFFSSIILFAIILIDRFYKYFKDEGNNFAVIKKSDFIKEIIPFIKVFGLGFVLSLIYWYWPLFVYHGATPNDIQIYGWPDYNKFDLQIKTITDSLSDTFFSINLNSFENIISSIVSLLQLIGAVGIILDRNKNIYYKFSFLILIGALIGLTHHLVLFNLLHIHLSPGHLFQMLQFPLAPVEILLGFLLFNDKLLAKITIGSAEKSGKTAFSFLLLIIAILFFYYHFDNLEKNKGGPGNPGNWIQTGRTQLDPLFVNIKLWVLQNTNVTDVFLTNNEDGFMLNALTGRKVVTYRRTHAPVYTDMDKRVLDTAVILYGKNDDIRKELLKKYDVKYLFWTIRWFDNEFQIQNGRIVGLFDPLLVKDKPEYRKYLDSNGVNYTFSNYYLDPASLPTYPTYPVLIVLPANTDIAHPWNNNLDKYLKLVTPFGIQQGNQLQLLAAVYKVNVN